MHDHPLLDHMRYAPEKTKVETIMDTFGLEPILAHFEREGGVKSLRDKVLGQHLKLTRTMAPRLFGILETVREALDYDEPVDLFVGEESSINAFAVHSLDGKPHFIGLTSGLIERMNDAELRFVLGHEIGHLHYRHYRMLLVPLAFGRDDDNDSKVPSLLARRLEIWQRLSELSADRAGFVAAGGELDPIVSAFFKIASGLGPEHLRFDIAAFLQQLEELKQLERRDAICDFSHPATPVRVRALQLYRDAGGARASAEALAGVDAEVLELAKLMERTPSDPEELHRLNFLLAGGVLMGHADRGGLGEQELQWLIDMLLPLTSDPEETIAGVTSVAQAEQLLQESAAWMRDNLGEARFQAFKCLCIIAVIEGLTPGEEKLLEHIADLLGIPRRAARDSLHEVHTHLARKTAKVGSSLQALKA